ncbi:hypothetical protein, partial [Bradyrhizobium uaiense]|uniref:hypothetical protein n=1 Tax=Bradyrhizobium uaiense TaxID=2594946 RepID=UPI0019D63816
AYKIENGKLGAPLKGAMLIGNGPTDLHRITMIAASCTACPRQLVGLAATTSFPLLTSPFLRP